MEIKNPRRILAVGKQDSGILPLLRALTGDAPAPTDSSVAGLTHTWQARTSYYTADVPVWLDQIDDLNSWSAEFLKPEAGEVVEALGAWVYTFRRPVADGDLVREDLKLRMKFSLAHGVYRVRLKRP